MVKPLILGCLSLFSFTAFAANAPFADIHIHYNWTQKAITTSDDIISALNRNNIALTVISSTPTDLALEVSKKDPRVIALFSPYTHEQGKRTWFRDEKLVALAREGISKGDYHGIGEVHFMAGFKPQFDNTVVKSLFALASELDVPVLIHVDTSHVAYYERFCKNYQNVRFLLAHAGGILQPKHIETILDRCPNTWVELSARDTWRYNRFISEDGKLPDDWKALFIRYADRFMTGTDPVWSVTKTQRWDEDDEGWQHYDRLVQFHRDWLSQLPSAVTQKIRLDNAMVFFGRTKNP